MATPETYRGSRLFTGFADSTGMDLEQLNFIFSQVLALLFAGVLRTTLHPSKASAKSRHYFELFLGVCLGLFCFGTQTAHLLFFPGVCYAILLVSPHHYVQRITMVFALSYLSYLHLYRQFFTGPLVIDVTGPIMVITQKVTSAAFNYHDGMTKSEDKMTKLQKKYAIYKTPTILEYFAYCLSFQTLMAGPGANFRDYMQFIEGEDYQTEDKEHKNEVPSPNKVILKKAALASFYGILYIVISPRFPVSRFREDSFLESSSLLYKFWVIYITTTVTRFKYYFAWIFADAICNNSGMGFNGFDSKGNAKWDKMTNIDVWKFELGTNMRESIDGWNMKTNQWLRMVAYERVKSYPTVITYTLSAVWHGFYPGYYLTFAGGAFFTACARIGRKYIRDYFTKTAEAKAFYDVLTTVITRIMFTYIVFSFVLLEFEPSIRIYMSLYWCLHLVGLVMLAIPIFMPKPNPLNVNLENTLRHVGPISNSIL